MARCEDVLAAVGDGSRLWFRQSDKRASDRCLAASGFPDKSENFTAVQVKRYVVDSLQLKTGSFPLDVKRRLQSADAQDRFVAHADRPSVSVP